ncbi:MAG TPA: hypothetical protein VEL82_03715 [Thermoplasmata archaeon]|nr:hypothetical protein [Thermoplasmata archaeon]
MSPAAGPDGLEAPLVSRFRAAAAKIAWREAPGASRRRAPGPASRPRARIAHLHDEEARVETRGRGRSVAITVDSGPVGALVLLLESDARGPPRLLEPIEASAAPGFPGGAIRATWATGGPSGGPLSLRDLAELARYALA